MKTPTLIQGRDFVFTGLQPWDISIGSNARDIALEVSQHNRVLYVNTPLSKFSSDLKSDNPDMHQRQKVLNGQASPLRRINDNLWLLDYPFTVLPVNGLPDGAIFNIVNRINNRKLFKFINQVLDKIGFEDVIHFNDNDIYRSFYAKEYLHCTNSIYYRRDNVLAVDYWKKHGCRLEPMLISKSDLVLCNSAHLADVARQYNNNTFDTGQGLDLSAYNIYNTTIPDDILGIARPIVGYLGHLTSLRLDADLIYDLALQNPSLSFVLVGGMDDVFATHRLHELENVHFLGSKNRGLVPNYINSFDICINPQLINELTIGNYPRKIDEYLAFGKATIATKTLAMMMFEDYVYLCDSLEDYQRAIDKIVAKGSYVTQDRLIAFAQTHTWTASVESMYKAIEENL